MSAPIQALPLVPRAAGVGSPPGAAPPAWYGVAPFDLAAEGGGPVAVRIALAQLECAAGNVEVNLTRLESVIAEFAPRADLIVFPETATTGSALADGLRELAEPIPGPASDRLARAAAAAGVHVVTGLVERRAGGAPYNSAVWVDPRRGVVEVYRKVHLFDAERECFTPGDRPAWVDAPWGRTALTICYDLCFPEYVRVLALAGATLVVNSTNWFADAATARWGWSGAQVRALAVVRALENGLFVAMACRAGQEFGWRALGHSTLAGPSGRVQAELGTDPGVVVGLMEPAQLAEWRGLVSYLGDRRSDVYGAALAREGLLDRQAAGGAPA